MFSNGGRVMARTIRVVRGGQSWVELPGNVVDTETRRSGTVRYTIRFDDDSEQFCDESMVRSVDVPNASIARVIRDMMTP